MRIEKPELWEKICRYDMDTIDAELPFSKRLARDNNWSVSYTNRVIEEYKRFVYLALTSGHSVTPSEDVDEVWHLHLLYTEEYWEKFTKEVLGKSLHHYPTKGGHAERQKFHDWYAKTLASYVRAFEEQPAGDIWPEPQERFAKARHLRCIDVQYNLVMKRSMLTSAKWLTGFVALAVIAQGAYASENVHFTEAHFALIVFIVALLLLYFFSKQKKKKKNDSGCSGSVGGCGSSLGDGGNDSGCGSGCGGGCGGG